MTTCTRSTTHTSATTPTRHIDAGDVRFAYRELGPRSGVPLVLLHHFTATVDDWDPRVLDGIADERHVIVFDNRGVGGTAGRVPVDVEAMARDAVAFIRALGLTEVDLLGVSLGGFVAQVIATEEAQLVRRLVLTGTGPAGFKGVGQFNRRLLADSTRGALTRNRPQAAALLPPHFERANRRSRLHRPAARADQRPGRSDLVGRGEQC